jgi:hypothetical protein
MQVRYEVLRWLSSSMLHCAVWYKFTGVSEVLTASIIITLMMEAVITSETYHFYETTSCSIEEFTSFKLISLVDNRMKFLYQLGTLFL